MKFSALIIRGAWNFYFFFLGRSLDMLMCLPLESMIRIKSGFSIEEMSRTIGFPDARLSWMMNELVLS